MWGYQPFFCCWILPAQSGLAVPAMNRDLSLCHARPLKRNPAPLSVCLRPTPPKRMKPNGSHEGLTSVTAPGASTKLAARGSGPLPKNPVPHPVASNGGRRANAEQWFNDSNKNVAHAPHASFIDGQSAGPLGPRAANGVQTIRRSTCMTSPPPAWVALVRFRRIKTPIRGSTVAIRGSHRGWSRVRVRVRNFEA